jgi:hypothetical protein
MCKQINMHKQKNKHKQIEAYKCTEKSINNYHC